MLLEVQSVCKSGEILEARVEDYVDVLVPEIYGDEILVGVGRRCRMSCVRSH